MALSACADSNTVSSLTQQDKKIIRSIADSYTNGFLEDDRTEIMGLFSADAVLIPHHGDPPVIGTEAIRDHFWPAESPPFRVDKFKLRGDWSGLEHQCRRSENAASCRESGTRKI